MDPKLLKDGIEVKIVSMSKTDRTFGCNSSMKKMVGKVFKVESYYREGHEVVLGDYCWHSDDLELHDPMSDLPSEAMMQEKKTFNPEEIMGG